jgi:hypothetical protein
MVSVFRRTGPWVVAAGAVLVAVAVVEADYVGLFVGPQLPLYVGGSMLLLVGGFLIGRRFFGRLLVILGFMNGIIAGIDREAPGYAWSYLVACLAALVAGSCVLWLNASRAGK